jgi:hypothetical protein
LAARGGCTEERTKPLLWQDLFGKVRADLGQGEASGRNVSIDLAARS